MRLVVFLHRHNASVIANGVIVVLIQRRGMRIFRLTASTHNRMPHGNRAKRGGMGRVFLSD